MVCQETMTFGNFTNNRVESMNQKVKFVCTVNSKLVPFYNDFATINSLRVEHDTQRATFTLKPGSTEDKRQVILTFVRDKKYSTKLIKGLYAFKLIHVLVHSTRPMACHAHTF